MPLKLIAHRQLIRVEDRKVMFIKYCVVINVQFDVITFQQDGMPARRSNSFCVFVSEFVKPENWPPNSPDLSQWTI